MRRFVVWSKEKFGTDRVDAEDKKLNTQNKSVKIFWKRIFLLIFTVIFNCFALNFYSYYSDLYFIMQCIFTCPKTLIISKKIRSHYYFMLNVLIFIRAAFLFNKEFIQMGRFQVTLLTVIWKRYFTKKWKSHIRIILDISNKVKNTTKQNPQLSLLHFVCAMYFRKKLFKIGSEDFWRVIFKSFPVNLGSA